MTRTPLRLNRSLISRSRVEEYDAFFRITQEIILGDTVISKSEIMNNNMLESSLYPVAHIRALLLHQNKAIIEFIMEKK